MHLKLRPAFALSLLLALALAGCKADQSSEQGTATVADWLPLQINDVSIEAQLAISPTEMQRGLMHRDELPENGGMLFLYESPRQASFWMANTRIPLDIGFFDSNGTLLEIHRMVPYDTTPTPSRCDAVRFALEMNLGWFSRNGLRPGATLNTDALANAIRQRGASPSAYGLD